MFVFFNGDKVSEYKRNILRKNGKRDIFAWNFSKNESMKKLVIAICLLGGMLSCVGGKKNADTQEDALPVDTMAFMADTLELLWIF